MPEAAAVLLPLAGAVAVSRVRVGVHRGVDVVAGAVVGGACGLVAARIAAIVDSRLAPRCAKGVSCAAA